MVYPEPCEESKKAAAIYGWDCPLLTFIYPGFDDGSHGRGLILAPGSPCFWSLGTPCVPFLEKSGGSLSGGTSLFRGLRRVPFWEPLDLVCRGEKPRFLAWLVLAGDPRLLAWLQLREHKLTLAELSWTQNGGHHA